MKRAASALLTLLGLTAVLVGVMGAVLVGRDGEWAARASVPAGRPALVIEPALVSVLGPRVRVRVTPEDAHRTLFVGRGRSDDVAAYLAGTGPTRVAHLDGSRRLDVRAGTGSEPLPAPADVDVWHQRDAGPGERTISWRPTRGADSVVVTGDGGAPLPALELSVSWRHGSWRWIPAGIVLVGLVLLAAGRVVRPPRRRKHAR